MSVNTQDTLFRQWHMLRHIPRHPVKTTTQFLCQKLADEGFKVTRRTVQRDLIELSTIFPLTNDCREKPYGWSWQKDAPTFDLPGLTTQTSLMLMLVEQHLSGLLPSSTLDHLTHYFDAARRCLNAEAGPQRSRSWLDKVRTVPASQPLLAPSIDVTVQQVITEALLNEKQVQITYKRAGRDVVTDYHIHPLALVQRGPVIYVHTRIFDYADTRILALHRIQSAKLLEENAVYPEGYRVDETIEAGVWGFGPGETVKVELLFKQGYADHLLETPLAVDQQVELLEDKSLRIKATVTLTPQFTWWVLGFGDGLEVVAPATLRNKLSDTVQGMVQNYR